MNQDYRQKDLGIMLALLQESGANQMPRLAKIRRKVESAVRLDAAEVAFLRGILKATRDVKPVFDRQSDFQDFYARLVA